MSLDLFKDWIRSINEKHVNLFDGADQQMLENHYPAFMINRALSQSEDTILQANVVNVRHDFITARMQYDFLMTTIPKKRRFSKWARAEKSEKVDLIKQVYNLSQQKAEIAETMISDDDVEKLKEYVFEGGRKSR